MINLKKQWGFTLVELAVVLAIVAALVVGSTSLFTEQKVNVERDVSQAKLLAVKIALLRFIEQNDFLPCPDSSAEGANGFGFENRLNTTAILTTNPPTTVNVDICLENSGTVPFEMLDLSLTDVTDTHKNLFHYAVTQGVSVANNIANCPQDSACFFNHNTAPAFNLTTEPVSGNLGAQNLELCAGTNCSGSNLLARGIVALVVAYNDRATASNVSSEEAENRDGDATFIQLRAPTESFDDLLVFISGHEIKRNEEREFRENSSGTSGVQSFSGNDLEKMGDNSIGGSGTNIGSDEVTWDRVNQLFDFGTGAANQKIVLTYNSYVVGAWDQPETTSNKATSDRATISNNKNYLDVGNEEDYVVYEYKYDHKRRDFDGVVKVSFVAGGKDPDVDNETYRLNDTYNQYGQVVPMVVTEGVTYETYQPYWNNDSQEIVLTTDANGLIDLEFAVGTTATVETIDFTNIELVYYNSPPPVPDFPGVSPVSGITQTNGLE